MMVLIGCLYSDAALFLIVFMLTIINRKYKCRFFSLYVVLVLITVCFQCNDAMFFIFYAVSEKVAQ